MEEPVSKRHHYVPQSYLAFFTKEFSKKSTLQVHSIKDGKTRHSSPNGVAFENNFDSFEAEGHRTDVFEKGVISEIESDSVEAIKAISRNKALPDDKQHLAILYLMGLLASRNPNSRASRDAALTRGAEIYFRLLASSEKLYSSAIRRAKKQGIEFPDDISFKKFREYIEVSEISVRESTTVHLDFELPMVDDLTGMFWDRHWSLIVLENEDHEFICSDHPISLRSKLIANRPYGYKSPKTEVFFPLTTKLGYYGVYENPRPEVVGLSEYGVAAFNSMTRANAKREVYSRSESFLVLTKGKPSWIGKKT